MTAHRSCRVILGRSPDSCSSHLQHLPIFINTVVLLLLTVTVAGAVLVFHQFHVSPSVIKLLSKSWIMWRHLNQRWCYVMTAVYSIDNQIISTKELSASLILNKVIFTTTSFNHFCIESTEWFGYSALPLNHPFCQQLSENRVIFNNDDTLFFSSTRTNPVE